MVHIKFISRYAWLVLLFISNNLIGQDYLEVYNQLIQKADETLEYKIDSLLDSYELAGDLDALGTICYHFAVHQISKKGNLLKATTYAERSTDAFEKGGIVNEVYSRNLYNQGRFYSLNEEYNKAVDSQQKVIDANHSDQWVGSAYAELGVTYNKMGDFFRSALNYEKGIDLIEVAQDYKALAQYSINLAIVYRNIGSLESLEKRLKLLQKADSLNKIRPLTKSNQRILTDAFANQYISPLTYDFKKAKSYYLQNLKASFDYNDSNTIALTYNNLSNLYNLEKHDSALYFAKEGLRFVKNRNIRARLLDNKAEFYLIKSLLDSAINSIHNALEVDLNTSFAFTEVPSKYQLSQSRSKHYTLFCLKKKTQILLRLFEQTNNDVYLKSSIQHSRASDLLIDIIQEDTSEEDSRFFWRKEASAIYLQGAYAAHLSGDSKSAFSFIEKNKALLLTEGIAQNTAYADLPKNIADRETQLRKVILELENELSRNDRESKELSNSLFDSKVRYGDYLDSIKILYPKYFQDKIEIAQTSLMSVKQDIGNDEALVSFIWNKLDNQNDIIVGLLITKSQSESFLIRNSKSFESLLVQYRDLTSRPLLTAADKNQFEEVSFELYQKLFPTERLRSSLNVRKLKIIPDGGLQSIPFEALIVDNDTKEFLFDHSDISYLYSMSFLTYNGSIKRSATEDFIGYSPISFSKTNLSTLNNVEQELNDINQILNGSIQINNLATKKHFLQESRKQKIIHLATHASAGENPWIAFDDGKLELHELYSYKNTAELVTLSACNTSLGQMALGEGVLSLTRGFFYSGAKSVVSSLWSVNDKSTQEIMTDFYANLKSGQSKSEALNNAKRSYLANHSLSELSPYYWSAFILVGDTEPIDFSNYQGWYIAIFVLLLLFAIYLFRKKLSQ